MEARTLTFSQLFLRIALSFSFLSAVADRFGFWGTPGSNGVVWGNWQNFVAYSNSVNSFLPESIAEVLAVVATVLEIILPLLLLVGYQLRAVAFLSGMLLATFGIAMTVSLGFKTPFDYSVWTAAGGCFLLSSISNFRYSLDGTLKKKTISNKTAF